MLASKEELQEGVQVELAKLKRGDIFKTEKGLYIFVKHTETAGLEVVKNLSSQESRYRLVNSGSPLTKLSDFRGCITFEKF